MHRLAFLVLVGNYVGVHASFHVQYPWATRATPLGDRVALRAFDPFCGKHHAQTFKATNGPIPLTGDIIRNPQSFSGYKPTFVSFSGNAGDLVNIFYTRNRVPRNPTDFPIDIVKDAPISPTGHLCFDIQMPTPLSNPEYGVLLFEARSPTNARGGSTFFCSDVKLLDLEILGKGHPAMCAANNETLIPMPDEWL